MGGLQTLFVPINKEGYRFIAVFAVVSFVLFQFWSVLGWVGVILTLWCAYFFRDPPRHTPTRPGLVISPADGVVCLVDEAPPPPELDMGTEPRPRVAIFMNVFDVHVNRAPIDGTIGAIRYRAGKFLNAALDKASEDNERQAVRIDLAGGRSLAYVQIAGLVARRIVGQVHEGEPVLTGQRVGLIRFGSRVDVYLPVGVAPLVDVGQRAVAGETVIADLESTEARRTTRNA
ncbi:MAG: phosphatidylserine decarboxylase [Alphaproteobacteria bacterium]|nr:phosphatidylserine decarboxylase [Alphaproteobacteria bacterium]